MLKSLTFKTLALLLILLGGGNLVATADAVTDVLNRELTGVTGTSYADWSGKTSSSDAVYAGQSAGGNESIQLRSNGNNSGVVTTASGGTVKKITVTWNESTQSGRTLNVYGKNSAYSAATDLYNTSTQGELLGTIVCGTSTELVITDEYAFIGFRSAGSAMYLTEVDIVWETSGSTPPPPTTYTVTYDCNGGTSGCPSNLTNVAKGTVIQLADAPLKDGFTFSGWSDGTNTYEEGEDYTVNSNITFTAQWTESGEYSWVETSLADLTDDDVFVIVGNNGSNYAMSNDKGASNAPTAVAVTLTNGALTSTVTDNIQWTLSVDDDGNYTFYPNGNTEKWLYCINNNNGVRVGTGEAKTFSIQNEYLYNLGQERFIGIYNSQDWRCYIGPTIHNNIKDQTFAFYKKVTDGEVPPSITAENVEIEYNATQGSIAYTINNPVDDGNLTAVCAETWITLGNVQEAAVPFTATVNENGSDRSATVTLTYTYGSKTVTKQVTVKQKSNPNAIMTIAQVRAQATGNVNTKGVVTSCVGTTAYIQDATAAICVYGSELTVGDEITVSGTLSTYKGLLEITNPVVTVLSSNNVIEPEVMTIAEINSTDKQGWLVKIEEATVTAIDGRNTTIAQGENTIAVRDIPSTVVYAVNDIITLTGNIGCFDNPQIANPTDVEVQQSLEPTLTLNPTTIEVGAEGGEGTITVTKVNLTGVALSIEGGEDWVEMEENDGNIDYSVEANGTTEERTATFTITCGEAEPVTVTIIQAAGEEQVAENTDVLTRAKTGVEGTSYKDWKDVQCNTNAIYAGNTAGGNDAIQMRSSNNSGIITTATGGDVKSVTVVWNSNTAADRTLDVYGKATAYESTADLYNKSTQGTLLGSITIGEDQPTTLTIDGSYQFIGLRSASGAMYLDKITIVWDTEAVPQPSISVSPETIEVPAEGGNGDITLTKANLGDESLTISGEYDWATLQMNGDNLKYIVNANKGEERTAIFTISAGEASATVKIIQAAYVAPTVAALPFEFNGGRADIEGTDGLTMDGIDTDYAAPTTKLKFNTTGDWLLLTFDEEPGLLFFDIKGNSFGTGTFSVQVSEDGEEFADLATFGSDEIEGSTLLANQGFALGSGVRYVKWIYTEKNGGNVGLGNIRLQTPNATAQFEVTSAGWATHVTSYPVEFTDEVAYVVTAVSKTGAKYEKVSSVPAGTPILVKGEGTWNGTIVLSAEAPETNLLKASDGTVKGNGKIYALANGANGVGFYKVSSAEDAEPIPAGKCYLEIEEEGGEAREFIAIGDDATGVQSVAASLQQASQLFDLQGRHVQQPAKGLYIQNGKKIVVR